MLLDERKCKQCNVPFTPKRSDHWFCSGACTARFYRENPNPEYIHRELPHDMPHVCEECGTPYNINMYAERGGQRTPRYCSGACKQKAYRKRGKATQEQAQRRYQSDQARERAEEFERARQRAQEEYERAQRARSSGERQRRQAPRANTRMTWDRACKLLGLDRSFTTDQLRKHYQKMAKMYHPDLNHAPDATARMQEINAAYEYLK